MRILTTVAVMLPLLWAASIPLDAGWDEGVAAFKKGDYSTAAAEFQKVTKRNPTNWEAHFYLGRSHAELGKLERAERSLLAARRYADKPAEKKRAWKQLGFVYEKQKKYNKSIDAYQKAGARAEAARVRGLKRARVRTAR